MSAAPSWRRGRTASCPQSRPTRTTWRSRKPRARLTEVRQARALRRRTAAADMKILEIRRARMEQTLKHAEENAAYMVIRAPFDGLSVVQPVFKGSAMTEVQEGDDVRPGMPIVSVVDPTSMQVRARVSQVDRSLVAVGQPAARDARRLPRRVVRREGGATRPAGHHQLGDGGRARLRGLVSIAGSDAVLMPDLSAAVDVTVQQRENVLVLPARVGGDRQDRGVGEGEAGRLVRAPRRHARRGRRRPGGRGLWRRRRGRPRAPRGGR